MLQQWWLDRMATSSSPLQEKLTLFWHGHFATQNEKVTDMLLMYQQNSLFRHAGAGSFRDLVHQVSLQPAMLLYLDNDPNVVGEPNENFARELMELFSLGVNQYTQFDVAAGARAWTGFNTLDSDRRQYHFYPSRHDNGTKTFMGVSRNFDGPGIIDFILSENPAKKMTAARFIARKLWTFFAYPSPDTALLDAITQAFLDADLDVATLLRTIFLRTGVLFDDREARARAQPGRVGRREHARARNDGRRHEPAVVGWTTWAQQLFEPPNVAGWKNNAYWISTDALWARPTSRANLTWKAHDAGFLSTVPTLSVERRGAGRLRRVRYRPAVGRNPRRPRDWLTKQRADTDAWTDWQ